ncbi:MAG: ABC transporter ATP-binding protein [Elusimicrobia bacterium]|nr:ABC transporter ATP-binding protein [Elusimicrobiota bacterium]
MKKKSSFQEHLRFVGGRVALMLAGGAALGLILGVVEIAFAYALQAFLATLGALGSAAASIPSWLPHDNRRIVISIVALLGVARGVLQALQVYIQNATMEESQLLQRSRILRWALHGDSASSSHVTTMFNQRVVNTASALYSIQGLVVQFSTAALLGVSLLVISAPVTLAAAAALLLFAPLLLWGDRRIKDVSADAIAHWDKTNAHLLMSIRNLLLLQICGMQDREEALAQGSLRSYVSKMYRFFALVSLKVAVPQIAGPLLGCLIAVISMRRGLMSPGALITYFYLFQRLMQTFTAVNQNASSFVFGLPHYGELFSWWNAQQADDGAPVVADEPAPLTQARIGWRLKGVRFSYLRAAEPAVDKLDLSVDPGSTVVVTGPSGAGKSTLLGLMLGNLRPQLGSVSAIVDGKELPLAGCRTWLLPRVGYVGPESFLLEGTILQNITYGLPGSTPRADIDAALRQAECQFVASLPLGLEHPLTEQGQGLSAGQKQRLSLARALLRKPTILILDEATSNLDMETEARLVDTLEGLKGSMTIIAVTHRRELLRIADKHLELASRR